MAVAQLSVDLALNSAKFIAGIDKSNKTLINFENTFKKIGKSIATAAAAYVSYQMFESFIKEASEAEEIEKRLSFALEAHGYSWKYAKTTVDDFARSIQESTRFSDEQARQSLIDMTMYTRNFALAQEGAKLAMDMSVRTGQDLGTTTRFIGMATQGNVEMLGRYIPKLRNLDEILGKDATAAQKAAYGMQVLRVPLKISFFCAKYFYYVTLRSAIRFTLSNFNEGMEHDADRFVGLANTF